MKKLTLFSFFATAFLLLAMVSCKEEAINLTPNPPAWNAQTRAAIEGLNGTRMNVLSSSESSLVMELDVNSYAKNAVSIGGKDYFSITASEAHSMLKKGNPDLPEFSYTIAIPATAACNVRVVEAEYEDISLTVAPSKGSLISPTDPYTFSEVYEKDSFYPAKLASTDVPFVMRGVRGSVVRLHPFQYNPVTGTLRVYKKMQVEVSFSGTDDRNVPSGIRHTIDKSMEELFRTQFINYDVMAASSVANSLPDILGGETGDRGAPPGPDDPPTPVLSEEMLIICCDSFATDMNSLMSNKLAQYINVTTRLVKMSDVGTTAGAIASCIENDYLVNGNLTYVLLVGDVERVPTMSCNYENDDYHGASDTFYALLEGGDSIPDICVGRFSARTRSEVQTMVARTNYYENISVQSWQHKSIGISDDNVCNNAPKSNYEYMDSIMDMLASSVYGTGGVERLYRFNYYSNSALRADFIDKINDGAFVVNYIGNAMWYYWDIGYFTMNDIGELQNDNKLPFIYNAAPEVGNFTDSYHCTPPCFAEKWLTARNSVTGAATGAIGVYGSSIMIHPPLLELISASLYFNSMLTTWTSNTRHFGVLCYLSAINMRNQFGSAANHVLLTLNYFGDPSLKVIPNEYVAPPVD